MEGRHDDFVGREQELAFIDGFLAASRSTPGALLIEGSAGAGKTAVWRAGVERARALGHRVLSCRPARAEVNLLYGGLSDLLVEDVGEILPRLPRPQRRAIEIVLLLEGDGRPADQRALAAGVLSTLRELATDRPLLLAIDDAQWLDPASVLVIEYVLRRLRGNNVAVLASWRHEPIESADQTDRERQLDLGRALGESPQRVPIEAMSPGAIHQILRNRTGHPFPRRLMRRIHEASGGNPFFALEIAHAMDARRDEWTSGEPLALSASLSDLLADRFVGLQQGTRDALFVAAASSQPTPALVEAALGAPPKPLLDPAVDVGLIRVTAGRIEFGHPLLAAAAHSLPGPDERRQWHLRLAEVSPDVEARARHLALARPDPDPEVAELLHAAATAARSRGAPAEAGELYATAIGRLPDTDLDRRAQWAVEAAPVLRQAGDLRRSRALLEAVAGELPAGPLRSDLFLALSGLVKGDPHGDVAELALIERALEDAADDPRRRAAGLLNREMWERHRDRFDVALPLAREALTLAEQAADPTLLASALTRTADLEVLEGLVSDPVQTFERALEAGTGLQLDSSGDSAPAMLAACLIRAGRVSEARSLLLAERERVRGEGDESSLEMVMVFLTELEWMSGDWAQARAYAEEGLLVTEQAESRLLEGVLSALIALVDGSCGLIEPARSRAVEAIAVCEDVGDRSYAAYARGILGFIELSAGNAGAAREQFATYPMAHGIEGTKRIAFVGDHIQALVLIEELDAAAALADELARRGERLHRPTLSGAAARGMALVLGARGELDAAIASAERAVDLSSDIGLPFEQARGLLVLGDIQRRAKRRGAARLSLGEAVATFDGLGATAWSRQAASSLARVGGRVRHEGLTATEAQVAELVARGLTNKEVAAELFVTVRAVEANLSRIYAKLGVRSRTELAARL